MLGVAATLCQEAPPTPQSLRGDQAGRNQLPQVHIRGLDALKALPKGKRNDAVEDSLAEDAPATQHRGVLGAGTCVSPAEARPGRRCYVSLDNPVVPEHGSLFVCPLPRGTQGVPKSCPLDSVRLWVTSQTESQQSVCQLENTCISWDRRRHRYSCS
jgi:hypothetical protein